MKRKVESSDVRNLDTATFGLTDRPTDTEIPVFLPKDGHLARAKTRTIRPIDDARSTDLFCAAWVGGDSLVDDSVIPGDYAIIRLTFNTRELKPGRLCAVLTPYGLLIKHVYRTLDGKVRLVSANPNYPDILLDSSDADVQGIVVRIERDLP